MRVSFYPYALCRNEYTCTLTTYVFRYNRWDSPYINHFISADTIVPGIANPQNLNRYSYVSNNPLRYTDPTGHSPLENEGGGGCSTSGYCGSTPYSPPPAPVNYCETHPNDCGGNSGGGSGQGNGGGSTPTPSPVLTPTQTPTPSPTTTSTPAPGGANNYNCFTHPSSCGTGTPPPQTVPNITTQGLVEFAAGTVLVSGGLLVTALGGVIAFTGLVEIGGLSSIAPPLVIPTMLHAGPAVVIGGVMTLTGVGITLVGGYLIYDSLTP